MFFAFYVHFINLLKKVQVGKDQEKAQSEKMIPTLKTEVGKKLNENSGTYTMTTYR